MCGHTSDYTHEEDRSISTDVDTEVRTNSDNSDDHSNMPSDQDQESKQGINLSVSNTIDFSSNHDNVGGSDSTDNSGEPDPATAMRTSVTAGFNPDDFQLQPAPTAIGVLPTNDIGPGPHFGSYREYSKFRTEIETDYSNIILGGLGFASVMIIGAAAIGWLIKKVLARQARLYSR